MPRFPTALILMRASIALFTAGCRKEVPPQRLHAQSITPPPAAPKTKIVTGSIAKPDAKPDENSETSMTPASAIVGSSAWCAQRHVEAIEGKAPGGATVLAQKEAHDGICEQQRGITGNQ